MTRFLRRLYALLLTTGLITGLFLAPQEFARAQTPGLPDPETIDAYLEAQVERNRLPGLAVAIVQDGRTVFLQGYGEAGPGRPVTPQTQFYIGSVTKSFTAMAVMQLAEQGRLELDAPVQRYLPWFRVADPEASSQITIRHLLNHTSGLSGAGDPGANDYAPTLTEEIRSLEKVHLTAPLGSEFQYYNQNYRTLGLVIEQVSGQSYEDYLRTHIFAPLEMAHTVANPADAVDLAQGYGQVFGFPLPRPQEYRPAALPSGYLITNAEDLTHYMIALLDQGQYGEKQMVRSETLKQMFTPPEGIGSEYGMGWMITRQEEALIYHGGALENFHAFVVFLPERRLGLAILGNQNGPFQQVTGYEAVKSGLLDLLIGNTPQPAGWGPYLPLLGLPVIADLLNSGRQIWQLPQWKRKIARRSRRTQWIMALLALLFPLVIFFGAPPLGSAIMGEPAGWMDLLNMIPDVIGWILVGLALALVRGVVKVILIARSRD